jgi:hypothetical protein
MTTAPAWLEPGYFVQVRGDELATRIVLEDLP